MYRVHLVSSYLCQDGREWATNGSRVESGPCNAAGQGLGQRSKCDWTLICRSRLSRRRTAPELRTKASRGLRRIRKKRRRGIKMRQTKKKQSQRRNQKNIRKMRIEKEKMLFIRTQPWLCTARPLLYNNGHIIPKCI